MSDQNNIIAATLKVDSANASANVQAFNKDVKDAKQSLTDIGATSSTTSKSLEGASTSFKNIREQIAGMPGAAGEATESVGRLNTVFKALAANPIALVITAIVGALTLLYKAFTNTFEGAEKVEQIFSGIKAAAQALFDNIGHLASALVKFFTFDFSGAVDEINAVGAAVANAYSQMSKLTAQAQELHKEQLQNDLEQAERQKKLAVLREQANDESVSLADRKKALQELREASEENAKHDIDLAKRVTDNFIAQKTLEKDGALKNQDEINAAKIKQIQVETDNANELRRIDKQLTAANKQEEEERKQAAQKAAEEKKKIQQQYIEYTNELSKLQNETQLAGIKDEYAKEQQILENKITDQKRQLQQQFIEKKITQDQLNTLQAALDANADAQRKALQDKHNDQVAKDDADFQKKLLDIKNKITLDGISDSYEKEKTQLKIDYATKLADAERQYKDDAVKFQAYKQAIDDELKAEQEKIEEKKKKDDAKKRLDDAKKNAKDALNDPNTSIKAKQDAINAEQKQLQDAFDQKVITEQQYNDEVANLTDARRQIREQELNHLYHVADLTTETLDNMSTIFGKQTVIGKAFAVASATIATIESAVKSFNALADIPIVGPALGAVAAAAAIASGISNVKKIISVQVPGQGSGGITAPGGLEQQTAPIAPIQRGTKIDASSINDIGDAAKNGGRAYVLDADVKNNADRDARLNRAARLGR